MITSVKLRKAKSNTKLHKIFYVIMKNIHEPTSQALGKGGKSEAPSGTFRLRGVSSGTLAVDEAASIGMCPYDKLMEDW